jgi:hypothetical protein
MLESSIQSILGGGDPLERSVLKRMNARLYHGFGAVRIHSNTVSSGLNLLLGSRALAAGSDLICAKGAYDPDSHEGRELIAHELIHVLQQGVGWETAQDAGMIVRPAGDSLEQEPAELARFVEGPLKRPPSLRRLSPIGLVPIQRRVSLTSATSVL